MSVDVCGVFELNILTGYVNRHDVLSAGLVCVSRGLVHVLLSILLSNTRALLCSLCLMMRDTAEFCTHAHTGHTLTDMHSGL